MSTSLYFSCDQSETLTSTHLVLIRQARIDAWMFDAEMGTGRTLTGNLYGPINYLEKGRGTMAVIAKIRAPLVTIFGQAERDRTPSVMWFWELNWRSNIITGNVTNDSGDGSLTTCLTVVISTSASTWGYSLCSTYYRNISRVLLKFATCGKIQNSDGKHLICIYLLFFICKVCECKGCVINCYKVSNLC